MHHYKNNPDAPLREAARQWASEQAGVKLVWADEESESGARWVRYYPHPFMQVEAATLMPNTPLGGLGARPGGMWMLLRPTKNKRYLKENS